MQLTLVLPGLLARRTDGTSAAHAPALAHLLAIAGPPAREDGGTAAALAARHGVIRQTDWPLAPIRLAALGVDPAAAYWLAADPVTLSVGRADVQLAGVVVDLGRADADALVATLNAHFADDGLAFVAPRPDALFVRVATAIRLSTHPPEAALGRPLRALLPHGPDAGAWLRWHSEIEMLLHEHPVNVERERTGFALANSLWFSGGGILPPRPSPAHSIRTYATSGIATALAKYTGSPLRPLPSRLHDALGEAGSAESIVVALDHAHDVPAIERAWAAPARDALAAGSLQAVTLLCDDAGDAIVWLARRPGLWQRLAGGFARHDLAGLLGAADRDR